MNPRTRSIRSKIVLLSLVPLSSLVALWAFAAALTLGDVLEQRRAEQSIDRMSRAIQEVVFALGAERQASVTFLAARNDRPREELSDARARADQALALFRRQAEAEREAAGDRGAARITLLSEAVRKLGEVPNLRGRVDGRALDPVGALTAYNAPVDAIYDFAGKQTDVDDGALFQWGTGVVHGARAMDLIMRESALVSGAAARTGRLTAAEHRLFVELVAQQRLRWSDERALIPPDVYERVLRPHFTSFGFTTFQRLENGIAADARTAVDAQGWGLSIKSTLEGLNEGHLRGTRLMAQRQEEVSDGLLLRVVLAGGVGLVAVLASIVLSVRFGRGLVRELTALRRSAADLAGQRLPGVVARLVRGEKVDVAAESPPPVSGRTTEVAAVAEAFGAVQRTAVGAAVGQAELREGVRRIFLNIARRNQSLLHRQLAMLDTLESRAEADDLAELFKLDHLTTRMRRHAESLIILSGATPGRGWRRPVAVADVLRGAVGEIEDYTRVSVLSDSPDGLVGAAVTDVIHLLAELLDNAAAFSPPATEIRMMAERVGSGFVIEVEDRGLGVRPDMLDQINRRLADPPEFDLVDADQLGLFVVARLAARHGAKVSLRPSPYGGTSAIVLLPHELVVPAERLDDEPDELGLDESGEFAVPEPQPEPGSGHGHGPVFESLPDRVVQLHGPPPAAAPAPAAEPSDVPSDAPAAEPFAPSAVPAAKPFAAPSAVPYGMPAAEPFVAPSAEPFAEPPAPPRPPANPWFDDDPAPAPDQPVQAPAFHARTPAPEPAAAEPATAADTHAGLPRRRRQESLAPQLRTTERPPPPATGDSAHGVVVRSPEQARTMMSSIQQGWRRGRAEPGGDGAGDTGEGNDS
ncbi:sensor histidine kinase [Actinomadura hibisca]|uniref:sensor histidine kinase n=1 Tax=Actinomadura hibisca TaxID=68565 RepID=UPI000836B083|nr:nitrate- and nitrite sensing domain-containing protein [Actinomadura hibisca]